MFIQSIIFHVVTNCTASLYDSLSLIVQSFTDIFGLVPANFQIPTKLCTDLPKGMNKRFSVGDIFFTLGKTQEGHAHLTVGKF